MRGRLEIHHGEHGGHRGPTVPALVLVCWFISVATAVAATGPAVLNPDAFIVKTNLALMREGRQFDASYNSRLSDDAIPVLMTELPLLDGQNACLATSAMRNRLVEARQEDDLRSWNLSRSTAKQLLLQNDGYLYESENCPPLTVIVAE